MAQNFWKNQVEVKNKYLLKTFCKLVSKINFKEHLLYLVFDLTKLLMHCFI